MIQLKTDLKYKWGQTNTLPIVGEAKISDEGIIEVADQATAELIQDLGIGFVMIEQEALNVTKNLKVDPSLGKEEEEKEEELNPKVDSISDEEREQMKELMTNETLADLKIRANVFPAVEWRSLNKAQLIDYLASKL